MTYVCQGADANIPGNNIYIFTMRVFRDCFNGNIPLDGVPGPGGQSANISIYQSGDLNFPFDQIDLDEPLLDTIDANENNHPTDR